MFQDIGVSKDLNEQFKKHLTNSEPLDCEYPRLQLLLQERSQISQHSLQQVREKTEY